MRPFWALGVGVVEEEGASNAQIEEVVLFGTDLSYLSQSYDGVMLFGASSDTSVFVNPMLEFATSVVITGYYVPNPDWLDGDLVDLEGTALVPLSVPLPTRLFWPGDVVFGLNYDDAVAAGLPANTDIIARISVDGGEPVLARIFNYDGSGEGE